jgi:L-threonylcarbamoyladenylate synthase
MAVSSANISGKPAALTCDEAIEQLGDSIAIYLDGGPLQDAGGAPSTIVDFTRHEDGQVLRRGAISVETLRQTAPNLLDLTDEGEVSEAALSTRSGQDEDEAAQDSGRDEDEPSPSSWPNPASGG